MRAETWNVQLMLGVGQICIGLECCAMTDLTFIPVQAFWEWDVLHFDKCLAACDELQPSSSQVSATWQDSTARGQGCYYA